MNSQKRVERMRKYRNRFGIQYERVTLDWSHIVRMNPGDINAMLENLVREFAIRMRAKYMWTAHRYEFKITLHDDYDIDRDQQRWVVECRPIRVIQKPMTREVAALRWAARFVDAPH